MQIGKLNKRITFLRSVDSTDELGQSVKELQPIRTCWASFYPTRGNEYYEAQKIREQVTYKAYCRYFTGLTSDCFIEYQDKQYEIKSVLNVDMDNKMYEIYCVEHVDRLVGVDYEY